jgi:hypothetical protein
MGPLGIEAGCRQLALHCLAPSSGAAERAWPFGRTGEKAAQLLPEALTTGRIRSPTDAGGEPKRARRGLALDEIAQRRERS